MNRALQLFPCLLLTMCIAACSGGDDRRAGADKDLAGETPSTQLAPDFQDTLDETPPLDDRDNQVEVVLYFADDAGRLTPEPRLLERQTRPADQARQIVQALLDGPMDPGMRRPLSRVLPPETRIRAVHLNTNGTVYIDLDASFARGLSRGSEDALIAVRALTETLAANLEEVSRLKILVDGEEVTDLGGHLDLSQPLVPSASL